MQYIIAVVFAFLLVMASRNSAAASGYTFVDLGTGPKAGSAIAYAADKADQGGDYIYGRGSCGKDCSFNIYHAVVWAGPGSTPADITPPLPYFVEGWVLGGSGSTLVGYGVTDQGGYYGVPHALVWRGGGFAWEDINPAGDSTSTAYAVNGSAIVGSGDSTALHALLWPLTNLSAPIDLHPGSNYTSSEAYGIDGSYQVGYAVTNSSTPTQHAMLWNGSAASAIDLTPANVTQAFAYAASSTSQAGCGVVSPATAAHALIWHGSSGTMRDLHPTGFIDSCVRAVRGKLQAGLGHVSSGVLHAIAWSGTAKSAVDLHQFAGGGYLQSEAWAIDPLGDLIGAAESASDFKWHAVMWMPAAAIRPSPSRSLPQGRLRP